MDNSGTARRKVGGTIWTVRIVIKQTVIHTALNTARNGPVGYLVVYVLRVHVPHILRVVSSAHNIAYTVELTGLIDYIPHVSALAYTGKFTVINVCSIAYYGCNCPHAYFPFSSGFALNNSSKQLAGSVGNWNHLLYA